MIITAKNKFILVSLLFLSTYSYLVATCIPIHEDISAVFSQALRIYDGQVQYRDYSLNFGIVGGYLAALLLKFLDGNIAYAFIIASILLCCLEALLAFQIVYKYCRNSWIAFAASIISGLWGVPQIGGFYYDNLAIALGLLAFNIVYINSRDEKYRAHFLYWFVSGILIGFSILTKQNSGFATAFAFMAAILVDRVKWTKAITFFTGCFFSIFISLVLIYSYSEVGNFIEQYIFGVHGHLKAVGLLSNLSVLLSVLLPRNYSLTPLFSSIRVGILLYLPIYILQQFFYFITFFCRLFNQKVKISGLPVFIMTANIICQAIIGRGFTNTNYFLGIIFAIVAINYLNSRIIIFIIWTYCALAGIGLSLKPLIFSREIVQINYLSYIQQADSHPSGKEFRELYRIIGFDGGKVSFVGMNWVNQYSVLLNVTPVNWFIFNDAFKTSEDFNKNIEWQNYEINNINIFQPSWVITANNNSHMGSDQNIIKYIEDSYHKEYVSPKFILWKKN